MKFWQLVPIFSTASSLIRIHNSKLSTSLPISLGSQFCFLSIDILAHSLQLCTGYREFKYAFPVTFLSLSLTTEGTNLQSIARSCKVLTALVVGVQFFGGFSGTKSLDKTVLSATKIQQVSRVLGQGCSTMTAIHMTSMKWVPVNCWVF